MAEPTLFDEASLALIASGGAGKDGKVYSVKPTDSTGDFTFSRGSNLSATRVGPTGLIEKGRENLLLQSNQFDTTWDYTNNTLVSGQSGYDGSNNAWFVTKIPASYVPLVQSVSVSGVNTFSFYAKAGTAAFVRTYIPSGNWIINFDFASGNATNQASTNGLVSYSMTSVGNGWYRCSSTHSGSITEVRIYNEWAETNASTYYIQDAQLEIGLAATEVITTGATTGKAGLLEDEPRLDYSGGATCPSLLLEPSRTNVLGYSEYLDGWNLFNNMTPTANDAISPEGLQNAYKIETTAGGAYFRDAETLTAGYNVFSIFVKRGNSQYIFLRTRFFIGGEEADVWFDVQSGTKGGNLGASVTYDIEDYGNGWYRCYLVHNVDAGDLFGYAYVGLSNTDEDVIGESGLNGYFYGGQWEVGSYPTSYIPNHSGGSVTRGADSCTGAGDASTFNDSEGVLYAEISALADDLTSRKISLNSGTSINQVTVSFSTGASNKIRSIIYDGSSVVVDLAFTASNITLYNKIAIRYKSGDTQLWVNGVKVATNNSAFSGLNLSNLSFNSGSSEPFYGKAKQVLVFKEALSDTELIKLTTI